MVIINMLQQHGLKQPLPSWQPGGTFQQHQLVHFRTK
jgi:hypothetical protein